MLRITISTAVLIGFGLAPVLAAPAGLLNKTIHLSYTSSVPSDDGLNYPPRANAITMYVSSLGRVFMKRTTRAGRYSEGQESVGGSFRFEGVKLIGTRHFGNGAGRIIVSFDSAFQSCSVELIVGSEKGKRLEWTSLNGVRRAASGRATFSGQTCSIESGNAFAH
jgi:hypothetical protein